jgi:hypothetical protein
MNRRWHYLINQCLSTTVNNYKKAYKVSREHDMRLKKRMDDYPTDLDYVTAYERYHPAHVALEKAYNFWKSKGGLQKGETLTLMQLLVLLPERINKIDVKIQAVYEKGSERYVQLFPLSHKPFYRGKQDTKINAVETLSLSIGSDADLAAVKTIVDGIHEELIIAQTEQTGAKGTTDTASGLVEEARIKVMTIQYQNIGFLINKFPNQPDMIEPLFDVETMTNPEQTIWKGHLDKLEVHPTLIHTFAAGDMMRLKSTGKGKIAAYLASIPSGTDSTEMSVEAHQELIFDVSKFNVLDYSKNRYLTLVNKSDVEETRFVVELY